MTERGGAAGEANASSAGSAGGVWLAVSTAPDATVAEHLARLAVERGQAACANLIPGIRSIYAWKGRIEDGPEVLILFKTTAAAFPGLADLVARSHPYEVPELIGFPLAGGLPAYVAWVADVTSGAPMPPEPQPTRGPDR